MSANGTAGGHLNYEYVSVGGCPTYILKAGSVTDRLLFLIIPGNPGVATYYEEFAREVVKHSEGQVPVWCISHAGHVNVPKGYQNSASTDYTSLQGQILHKVQFMKEHVPANTRVVLIGHSIGAYMILHMLKSLPPKQVVKCMLLFPTIERLAMTSQGKFATPMLKYCRWMAPVGIFPASTLPDSMIENILRWYFGSENISECAIHATKRIVGANCIRVITNMANEEMQNVVDADYDLVEEHLQKLMFYYGASDHWCPVEYYEDMKAKFPEHGDIFLCQEGFDHAFVLEGSVGMAKVAWEWILKNVQLSPNDK